MNYSQLIGPWAGLGMLVCVLGFALAGCVLADWSRSDIMGGGIGGMAVGWAVWAAVFFMILSAGVSNGTIPR